MMQLISHRRLIGDSTFWLRGPEQSKTPASQNTTHPLNRCYCQILLKKYRAITG